MVRLPCSTVALTLSGIFCAAVLMLELRNEDLEQENGEKIHEPANRKQQGIVVGALEDISSHLSEEGSTQCSRSSADAYDRGDGLSPEHIRGCGEQVA